MAGSAASVGSSDSTSSAPSNAAASCGTPIACGADRSPAPRHSPPRRATGRGRVGGAAAGRPPALRGAAARRSWRRRPGPVARPPARASLMPASLQRSCSASRTRRHATVSAPARGRRFPGPSAAAASRGAVTARAADLEQNVAGQQRCRSPGASSARLTTIRPQVAPARSTESRGKGDGVQADAEPATARCGPACSSGSNTRAIVLARDDQHRPARSEGGHAEQTAARVDHRAALGCRPEPDADAQQRRRSARRAWLSQAGPTTSRLPSRAVAPPAAVAAERQHQRCPPPSAVLGGGRRCRRPRCAERRRWSSASRPARVAATRVPPGSTAS